MKKVVAIVLALAMVLALVGCTSRKLGGMQFFVAKDGAAVEENAE